MKHPFFSLLRRGLPAVLVSGLLLAGCSSDDGLPPGDETPGDDEGFTPVEISVSGTAALHPAAKAFYDSQFQTPPSLVGLTLRVEEPLKVALGDEDGVFGEKTLDDTLTFSVEGVRSDDVNLGVAGGIRPPESGTPLFIRSATTLYDVAFEGGQPDTDIVGAKVHAVTTLFHEKLSVAVGAPAIQAIAPTSDGSLLSAGFVLGRVIDAQGNPVSGAKVTFPAESAALQNRIYYPSLDLTSASQSSGTSASGLFVFVHDGDELPVTFGFNVDREGYRQRKAGAVKDAALLLDVYPGDDAP